MVDALETAAACGLSLDPYRRDEPSMTKVPSTVPPSELPFDAYPFVLSPSATAKLKYVHGVIARAKSLEEFR